MQGGVCGGWCVCSSFLFKIDTKLVEISSCNSRSPWKIRGNSITHFEQASNHSDIWKTTNYWQRLTALNWDKFHNIVNLFLSSSCCHQKIAFSSGLLLPLLHQSIDCSSSKVLSFFLHHFYLQVQSVSLAILSFSFQSLLSKIWRIHMTIYRIYGNNVWVWEDWLANCLISSHR